MGVFGNQRNLKACERGIAVNHIVPDQIKGSWNEPQIVPVVSQGMC